MYEDPHESIKSLKLLSLRVEGLIEESKRQNQVSGASIRHIP